MGEFAEFAGGVPKPAGTGEFAEFANASPAGGAPIPGINMGPEARRARGGGSPSRPRDLTSEEAGAMPGPIKTTGARFRTPLASTEQFPAPADLSPDDEVRVTSRHTGTGAGVLDLFGPPKSIHVGAPTGEMTDPLVQMGTAAAMGRVAGAGTSLLGAPALAPAIEGGVVNKASGGDFSTGAALGAAPALRGAKAAIQKNAPARVAARIEKNLAEDARKTVADAIDRKSDALRTVVERNPELRKTLAVADSKPTKALTAVEKASAKANAALDDDFATMREHYAEQPASAQASVPGLLDDIDKLLAKHKGDIDKTRPIRNARKAIIEEFNYDPAAPTDAGIITPDELRSLKRSIGRAAFPPGDLTAAKVKAQIGRDLYAPIARQLKTLAKNTPGLDVERFMAANEDVSTLIPVQEALRDKVKRLAEGKTTIGEKITNAAHGTAAVTGAAGGFLTHGAVGAIAGLVAPTVGRAAFKAGARLGRGIDYRLAESQLKNEAMGRQLAPVSSLPRQMSTALSAAEIGGGRDYAARVAEAMRNGASLKDAVTTADAHPGETTKLSDRDEASYQAWRAKLPKELQYEGDYDLRGFFKKNPGFTATSGQHMTDEFKLPNHKTFSDESRYYNEKTKHMGGHWDGDVYIPNDTRYKQRVDESGGNS